MKKEDLTEYADWLLRTAAALCDNLADAQDISQETMLAALSALDRGYEISSPKTWLSRTLRNKYYDMLRQKYRRPVLYCGAPQDIPETPYEEDDLGEEAETIRRELGYLAGIYREIMVRYYMKGERAKDIARDVGLSESAVKSRLHAGRGSMKKEFDSMENYTVQSYEPEELRLSCSGSCGLNDEPFSLVKPDEDIKQNLLILAYEKPLTVTELSKAIGIPAAYTEPIIDKLVEGELMKRVGNKVYTDFIVFKTEDKAIAIEPSRRFTEKNFDGVWANVSTALGRLREKYFYKRQNDRAKDKLELYFAVKVMYDGFIAVRDSVSGNTRWEDYPERPNGGRWFCMGNRTPRGYDFASAEWVKYAISGEYRDKLDDYRGCKSVQIAEYDTILGKTHSAYNQLLNGRLGVSDLVKLIYAVYTNSESDFDLINKQLIEQIDKICELGYFTKENGKLTVDIPVLDSGEYRNELHGLVGELGPQIFASYEEELAEIVRAGKIETPPHISGIPNFQRYIFTDDVIMMTLIEAKNRGLFLSNGDHKTPSTLLIIEK